MAGIFGQFLGFFFDDGRHQPNPNYQNPNPAGAVAAPYSPTTQEQPHASFINSHTQNMKGLINNTGCTKGDGSGSIICPVGVGVGVGVGRERQTEAQPRPNDTPKRSEEDKWNTKPTYQNIKGLTNQTGSIIGDANGLINLGEYTQSRP